MGPEEARLRQAVRHARPGDLDAAGMSWTQGASDLEVVAAALDQAVFPVRDGFDAKTAAAAAHAFQAVAKKVREKARLMTEGGEALHTSAGALRTAAKQVDGMTALDKPVPKATDSTMDHEQRSRIEGQNATAARAYQREYAAREGSAAGSADHVEGVLDHSAAVMRRISGHDPSRSTTPTGGTTTAPSGRMPATTSGGTTPTAAPTGPTGPQHHPTSYDPGAPSSPTTPYQPGTPTGPTGPTGPTSPAGPTGPHHPYDPSGSPMGPTGPTAPTSPGSPTTVPASTTGPSQVTPPGGVVPGAALGGTLAGGVLSGGLGISGALRGGPVSMTSTSASAVRGVAPIGSSSRTAGATRGALGGRGTSATTSGRGTSATGRGGSRGQAGNRGSGTGNGRNGGKRNKKDRKNAVDLFEDDEGWIDDEGAAPEVID